MRTIKIVLKDQFIMKNQKLWSGQVRITEGSEEEDRIEETLDEIADVNNNRTKMH